jgi:hypothetical protein
VTAWRDFEAELAAWGAEGRVATLWWRDDDAVAATPALDRLLSITAGIPLMLAAIPQPLEPSLTPRLEGTAAYVVQHGFAHVNHRPAGQKACEIGLDRSIEVVEAELLAGRRILADAFGPRFKPWLVPPWNRIDPELAARLPELGYAGLSCFEPRRDRSRVNAHVDPIAWKAGRRFIGAEKTLNRLTDHLAARRSGAVDAAEPTGFLTHHLVHDAALWDFLGDLTTAVSGCSSARWVDPTQASEKPVL